MHAQTAINQHKNNVNIRQANVHDADTLAKLGARTFVSTYQNDIPLKDLKDYAERAFSQDRQAQELSHPEARFLLATDDEKPCGYAKLQCTQVPKTIQGDEPIEFVRLYADSEWIGQGIGSALMQTGLNTAAEAGHKSIWLRVHPKNERAIRFYQRWGFEEAGQDSQPYQVGAVVVQPLLMTRPL
ncbi:GNAT family N-acetyltransferase [Chloroflexi bacterium TSY]|nr:GNAT family N-acetyltransferase [Chloroflexi bacterium TSY]